MVSLNLKMLIATLIVGDFNVDFSRQGSTTQFLQNFLQDNCLAVDLKLQRDINFTYERDDGCVHSWIDHIVCSEPCVNLITNVSRLDLASNLSDHHPLKFCFKVLGAFSPVSSPSSTVHHSHDNVPTFNWSSASRSDLNKFCRLVLYSLPKLPEEVVVCCEPNCAVHQSSLDEFCNKLFDCLLESASASIPVYYSTGRTRIAGWNDSARPLKDKANFWHMVWVEAGCPAGILAEIKKSAKARYKYAVHRLKRRQAHIKRKKLGKAFTSRNTCKSWNEIKKINKKSRSRPAQSIDGVSGDNGIAEFWASKLQGVFSSQNTAARNEFYAEASQCISSSVLTDVTTSSATVVECLRHLNP